MGHTPTPDSAFSAARLESALRASGWTGPSESVQTLANRLHEFHTLEYGEWEASRWAIEYWDKANSIDFPTEAARREGANLAMAGSIAALARQQQISRSPYRMSQSRIDLTVANAEVHIRTSKRNCPLTLAWNTLLADSLILREFAEKGVDIITDPSFIPNNREAPISGSYKRTGRAVEAHVHKAYLDNLIILIPREMAKTLPGAHRITSGWAPKRGKQKGRLTCNPSHNASRKGPQTPLNTEWVKLEAERRWGKVHLPTIGDIIRDVLSTADTYGRKNVVVFKTDLAGAFTLLNLNPNHVHLMVSYLSSGVAFVPVCGNFGWCAMGIAFNVVTRVLVVCMSLAITGLVQMYCDDAIAVSTESSWQNDRTEMSKIITTLLGDGAEAVDKQESSYDHPTRTIVVIGWAINLDTWRVDVSDDNRLKALYRFSSVILNEPMDQQEAQALCSLAQRYSLIYRELGVLTPDLNCLLGVTWKNYRKSILLPERSKIAILLWTSYLAIDELTSRNIPRGIDLESFRILPLRAIVEFDGSLQGVGARVFIITPTGEEKTVGALSAATTFDLKGNSSSQNAMELAAATVGLALAGSLGLSKTRIRLRGDSASVLQWTRGTRTTFRTSIARNAAIAFVATCAKYSLVIDDEPTHISSEENAVCDALSRNSNPPENSYGDIHRPLPGTRLHQLLLLCNPLTNPVCPEEFGRAWMHSRTSLDMPL